MYQLRFDFAVVVQVDQIGGRLHWFTVTRRRQCDPAKSRRRAFRVRRLGGNEVASWLVESYDLLLDLLSLAVVLR